MPSALNPFVARFVGTVALALAPVLLAAFTSMPMSLHHHIGTTASAAHVAPQHMS